MIIYKITNKINGKVYIGQTINTLNRRWKQHCQTTQCYCRLLHNAIAKYGKENFTVEQIDVACDRDELDQKEIYWIKHYDSMNPKKGYNLLGGGNKNHIVSEETRRKISDAQKGEKHWCYGKHQSDEFKQKLSEINKGKRLSEETKLKMSESRKGEKAYWFGKQFSEEHRKKLSEVRKGMNKGENHPKSKKVLCVETNEIFAYIRQAALAKNIRHQYISAACKRSGKAGNFHWRYVDEC